MAAKDIEDKVRKMSSQKPESGKDLQQLQEAQNQVVQINAERQGNLQTARLENNADAANNETMSQAVEMAALGGLGGGASVQQQVQAMNPQTQAVLGKYGLGQPKVQRSSSRSVQVTPQKITINNNTTNTTTNNVAVPAANIGGPVQGRTIAVKQDEGQARFKTWIANAFAKQNQQAAAREKEYQRREWSLTRSTNKLMKHLSDLGKSVSERLDPRKLSSSVGNQFKTILFLWSTMFLAKNWKRIIKFAGNIETFFFGEPDPNDPKAPRSRSGFSKMLVKLFGGREEEKPGEAFRKLWWNPSGEGGVGIFDLLLKKIKNFFEVRGAAIESIKPGESFNTVDDSAFGGLAGFFKDAIGYLGNILKIMIAGPKAAKEFITKRIKTRARAESFDTDDGRIGHIKRVGYTADNDWAEKGSNGKVAHMGLVGSVLGERNYITKEDFNSNGDLNLNVGSTTAQLRNIGRFKSLASTEGKIGVAQVVQGYKDLKNAAVRNNGRIPIRTGYVFQNLKEGDSERGEQQIKELTSSKDIITKNYRVVIRPRTNDEITKNSISPELAAALSYGSDKAVEAMGGRSFEKKLKDQAIGTTSGKYGGTMKNVTRSAYQLVSWIPGLPESDTAMAFAEYIDAKDLRENLKEHEILDLVPEDTLKNGLPEGWSFPKNESLLKPIPVSEVTPKVIDQMVKNYTGNENFTADTDSIEYYSTIQKKLEAAAKTSGKEISYIGDYDYISKYEELQKLAKLEKERDEEFDKLYKESRPYKSGEYILDKGSEAINSVKGKFNLFDNKEKLDFAKKMRDAYSKKFKEFGIDEKYIDALVAQDALESKWGTSNLATKDNNFGGLRNGDKGWQKFNSLDDYIDYKVKLLKNENGYYKNAFKAEDPQSMINEISEIYAPSSDGNNNYSDKWGNLYDQIKYIKPLSTEEIKSLRNQGKYIEANLASASWPRIEDVLRAGGVTDFKVTSKKRKPGEAGNAGEKSYHTTDNLAIDIVPTDGDFERLKQQLLNSSLVQEYFKQRGLGVLDETTKEALSQTGGTGKHYHIGPDNSSVNTWLAWNKGVESENKGQNEIHYADNYVEQRPTGTTSSFEWNGKSINPEFAPEALLMAQNNATVTPNKVTPVSSGGKSSTVPGNTSESTGKELMVSNDRDVSKDIYTKVIDVNENIKVLQKTSIAQAEALNNVSTAIASLKFGGTQGWGGNGKTKVGSSTIPPYNG